MFRLPFFQGVKLSLMWNVGQAVPVLTDEALALARSVPLIRAPIDDPQRRSNISARSHIAFIGPKPLRMKIQCFEAIAVFQAGAIVETAIPYAGNPSGHNQDFS